MSATPFEVQEALRGRARERREWLMDRSSLSHEEASVMATLDVAVVEIFALTKRAEAAEARRDVWEKRARKVVQERRALRVECEALRKDAARWYEHITLKAAIDAALAVQPTTGESA